MNSLPWETYNIMAPECLLSVMSPERRLDKRKWCVVLCWDNSPGSPADDRMAEIWSATQTTGSFSYSRVHEGRETPKAKEMSDSERRKLLFRDPQVLRVCMCVWAPSLHLHIKTVEKKKNFKAWQFQYLLGMKYRKLVPKLIFFFFHMYMNILLGSKVFLGRRVGVEDCWHAVTMYTPQSQLYFFILCSLVLWCRLFTNGF